MHNTYKRRILKGQAGLLAPIQNGGSSFSPLPPIPPINPGIYNTLSSSRKADLKLFNGGIGNTLKGAKSFISNPTNMSFMGQAADMIGSFMPENNAYQGPKGSITRGIDNAYDAAANMAMQINPVIGGAMKVGGLVSDGINAITGGTDGMTTQDSIFSSTLGNLTGLGIINSAFGKRANTINKDNETWEQQGSAYGGSLAKVDDALTKSGKKYGLFSNRARKKANAQISEAKRQQNLVADINEEAQDAFAASNYSGIGLRNQIALNGGYRSMAIGRNGIKILDKELQWANSILNKTKASVPEFKSGGKVNVIPEGALHKNKHHLEDVNPEFKDVTNKGIPVVSKEDGGELVQHAEIERNEIIFNLDVTNKLEELMKKGDDESAIEAGKLLVHEILNNTIDNTGILKEIQ
jgi:hypothetical protein